MRVAPLVTRIVKACGKAGAWLVRHMTQPRTTVEAWMVARGVDTADRRRWASAVGRKVSQVAKAAGVTPVRERIAIGAGNGWSDAYVYPADVFPGLMDIAWNTPDKKGLTYADKVGIAHSTKG